MIPKCLHQFWDTDSPPASVAELMTTWREKNQNWEYCVWTDKTTLQLIEESYTPRVQAAFEQCLIPAMRADLARYLILLKIGGVYADADLSCLIPLDDVIEAQSSVLVFRGWNGAWRNDFFGAEPAHPLVCEIIETGVSNVERRISNNVWLVTGPGMTTPIVEKYLAARPADFQAFEFHDVRGKILNFHHSLDYRQNGQHWADVQSRQCIFRDDVPSA
jgi:mannosyltransferase OCH1-like enzyme